MFYLFTLNFIRQHSYLSTFVRFTLQLVSSCPLFIFRQITKRTKKLAVTSITPR